MAGIVAGDETTVLLDLVQQIARASAEGNSAGEANRGSGDLFKKDCVDLVRKISLLTHLIEEIKDFNGSSTSRSLSDSSWSSDLVAALRAAKRLLSTAWKFDPSTSFVSCFRNLASTSFSFVKLKWRL